MHPSSIRSALAGCSCERCDRDLHIASVWYAKLLVLASPCTILVLVWVHEGRDRASLAGEKNPPENESGQHVPVLAVGRTDSCFHDA